MKKNSKGFKISLDTIHRVLRVRVWGFWDLELAQKYESAFTEKIEELGTNGEEWFALVDLTDFYPRSSEVQSIMNAQIVAGEEEGIKKIAYLGRRAGVQLQLNRMFREHEMQRYSFFESEEEALQWILDESSY